MWLSSWSAAADEDAACATLTRPSSSREILLLQTGITVSFVAELPSVYQLDVSLEEMADLGEFLTGSVFPCTLILDASNRTSRVRHVCQNKDVAKFLSGTRLLIKDGGVANHLSLSEPAVRTNRQALHLRGTGLVTREQHTCLFNSEITYLAEPWGWAEPW